MAKSEAGGRWQVLSLPALAVGLLVWPSQMRPAQAGPKSIAERVADLEALTNAQAAQIAALKTANSNLQTAVASLQTTVGNQASQISTLQTKTAPFSTTGNDTDGYEVTLTKANLNIVNGLGATDTVNRLGDLVIGYNETLGVWPIDRKASSHDLVIGVSHEYTSYGGLVVGSQNHIRGPYASVTGGLGNVASGQHSSVSAGTGNLASGYAASVSGGSSNWAEGRWSSLSGGLGNHTAPYDGLWAGDFASVSGGRDNTASGYCSSVSGGYGDASNGGLTLPATGPTDWTAGTLYEVGSYHSP